MRIKLAFTGTGYIAKIHARAGQNVPGVELAAVVNHRLESRAAFAAAFNIPRQYTTIEELLNDGDVTAVSINTPNYLHAPEAITALEAGVHVIVEKPMAINAVEAQAMIAASQKSGAILMVAHCWRFDEEVLWLKQQVEDGRIGQIVRSKGYGVHVHWGPGGWFTRKALAGGGALADMGVHAVDTVRFLLGEPEPVSLYAKMQTCYRPLSNEFDVDDTGILMINWDNGVTSYIESGWWQPHADGPEASTQLYGSAGFGQLFPTRLAIPTAIAREIETIDPGFPPVRNPHCPQSMYDAQMAYFVSCIRHGRTPKPGGAEGLTNMKILDAAYESSRTGTLITL